MFLKKRNVPSEVVVKFEEEKVSFVTNNTLVMNLLHVNNDYFPTITMV